MNTEPNALLSPLATSREAYEHAERIRAEARERMERARTLGVCMECLLPDGEPRPGQAVMHKQCRAPAFVGL